MTPSDPAGERRGRKRGETTVGIIARLAGVSAPTVSKVLNGRPGVALDTRRRVEAILQEQGYRRPDAIGPAPVLEVVFHALESHLAIEIMRGVEGVARGQSLAVGFTEMRGREEPGRSWLEQVLSRRPVGVIAVYSEPAATEQARLAASSIPLVTLDPTGEPLHDVPSVGAANWSGGVAATRHLLDLGHRRIAMVGGPTGFLAARARLDGFRAAMDAAGVPVDPRLVRDGRFFFEDGLRHGRDLLALDAPPTAVFCADDLLAFGVYEAARAAGRRVPEDLSVVGFDDLEFARWSGPALTTVRQPLAEMGAAAGEMVLALAAGITPTPHRVELATTLVIRDSTARLQDRRNS
ncbi:DNA-binding LacI/PurR family transcriptional regulator [Allocatelliglobosispora scoriae]|uniref:DNA-binding LacI/PurR family transcriptional regulator n=1 Tax=Allocatelliglobosispora scoriae TaxID=643052 RepID=A0A841BYR9_9ACTN|nr:LacI family DNA-binding transcriptional regulator [Allocatelliglobosispora scoriae]MBB5872815.1 DNA-binding LacI/PurR family transcriptional regulator [Allocatelliglobosispora scoriae]